jgi:endonuclease/exonuclease/phosphatase (EEP) superfamily protein YafD
VICFLFADSHLIFDNLKSFLLPTAWGCLVVWILCAVRARRRPWDLLIASFSLALCGYWLWPSISYLGVAPKRLLTGEFRLALSNVEASNRNFGKLLAWVDEFKPDVLVLIEIDQIWIDGLTSLEATYPHFVKDPKERSNFGLSVYSRFPILQRELRQFSAGDLNVTSWSPFYSAAFTDDLVNAREGFGVLPTWPSDFPAWMRTPIDQILLRGGLTVRSIRVGPDFESDHLPIEVVLGFSGRTHHE